jgi:uncharacterized protein (DUF697 family)
MHDLDRTQAEMSQFGPAEFGYETREMYGEGEAAYETEYAGEYPSEYSGEQEVPVWGEAETGYVGEFATEGPLSEQQELELTAELLEITSEEELDRFLGKLISSVGRAVGGVIRSPIGKALGGVLKSVAKRYLPVVGGALGSMVAPGVGTALGASLGSMAGRAFGMELEGLSAEDQEFEVARQYVRFASAAAQHAAMAPPNSPPQAVVQRAVNSAAQQFAPGLMNVPYGAANGAGGVAGHRRTGRWIRRGQNVILLGVYRHG